MNDTVAARPRYDSHETQMCWMLTTADRAPCLLVSRSCRSLEQSSRKRTRTALTPDQSNHTPNHQRLYHFCQPTKDGLSVVNLLRTIKRPQLNFVAVDCRGGLWARHVRQAAAFPAWICGMKARRRNYIHLVGTTRTELKRVTVGEELGCGVGRCG